MIDDDNKAQKSVSSREHIRRYRTERILHPTRDWFMSLVGASVLLVGTSVGAEYMFLHILASDEHTVTLESVTYDPKLIGRALVLYRARATRHQSLIGDSSFMKEQSSAGTTPTDMGEATSSVAHER